MSGETVTHVKFLVLLKPGAEQPAMERTAQYVRFSPRIDVTACRVITSFNADNQETIRTRERAEFAQLKRRYPALERMDLRVLFHKDVAQAFAGEALAGGYDLAVISANHRNSLKDLFISTIDSNIMRQIKKPLLVVKNVNASEEMGRAILIAVDLSDSSHPGLDDYLVRAAKQFADNFNGEVHILNCAAPGNHGLMGGETGLSKILNAGNINQVGSYTRAVYEFARSYGIADERVHAVQGRFDEEIPRLCHQLNARMVCMGTSPKSSFPGAIDTTAGELVLEQIRGDVFIVSSAAVTETKTPAE